MIASTLMATQSTPLLACGILIKAIMLIWAQSRYSLCNAAVAYRQGYHPSHDILTGKENGVIMEFNQGDKCLEVSSTTIVVQLVEWASNPACLEY